MKKKPRSRNNILFIAFGIFFAVFFPYIFNKVTAYTGPGGNQPGSGSGVIQVDANRNINFGTSNVTIGAPVFSTTNPFRILSSTSSPYFIIQSDGSISVATNTNVSQFGTTPPLGNSAPAKVIIDGGLMAKTLYVNDMNITGGLTGTVPAQNVTPGTFNASQANSGDYVFPGKVKITGKSDGTMITQVLFLPSQYLFPGSLVVGDGGGALSMGGSWGIRNTLIGIKSGSSTTTGNDNTAVGYKALASNLNGVSNTAVGSVALTNNTSANNNTAVGFNSLYTNTTGYNNTASGFNSLLSNTIGFNNTALGVATLSSNTTGNANTAIGSSALNFNTTGYNNAGLGTNALIGVTTGNNNTAIGYNAGSNITTGSGNIMIGSGVTAPLPTGSNQLNIGSTIYGTLLNNITVDASIQANRDIIVTGPSISPSNGLILSDEIGYKKIQSYNLEPLFINPSGNNVGIGGARASSVLEIYNPAVSSNHLRLSTVDTMGGIGGVDLFTAIGPTASNASGTGACLSRNMFSICLGAWAWPSQTSLGCSALTTRIRALCAVVGN